MEIIFGADEFQDEKDVTVQHLGGRLGQPKTFENGSRIPDQYACHDEGLPDLYSYFSGEFIFNII